MNQSKHKYSFSTYNGRVKVKIDGYVVFCFNQLEFLGYYSFKDDVGLYGIDFYMKDTTMETYYKTKENWLAVLKLLDENM